MKSLTILLCPAWNPQLWTLSAAEIQLGTSLWLSDPGSPQADDLPPDISLDGR